MNTSANQEIKHMLTNTSPPDIVQIILSEPCPYRQEELTLALQHCWRELENTFDERAVYQMDNQWVYRWPTMQDTIQSLLQRARKAQTTPKPTIPTTINTTTTKKPTTMPKKSTVHITNNFYGSIGQHIDHIDTQHVTFDKDMNMQVQHVQHQHTVAKSNPTAPAQTTADIDPSSLIFKPDEQNRNAVESLLKEILAISNKKSVICRKLYQQRELFNLHKQDDTTKAIIINTWIKKLGLERNFKALFSRKDFGNNYCKS